MIRLVPLLVLLGCNARTPTPSEGEAPAEPTPAADAANSGLADQTSTPTEPPTPETAAAPITLDGETGPITLTPVYHATFRLQHGETTVWFDPWSKADLADAPKADVLVLTDIHPDHADADAIAKVLQDDTVVIAPKAVDEKLADLTVQHVLANGESVEVAGMTFQAVPMYNLTRGPEEGGLFHVKGRGNGYVITVDGRRIYNAGDTACTDEMKALNDIDLALVPMNLPYTMPPDEAATCVQAFKPARVVPFHYAGSDLDTFEQALADTDGVEVVTTNFYPGGLPW